MSHVEIVILVLSIYCIYKYPRSPFSLISFRAILLITSILFKSKQASVERQITQDLSADKIAYNMGVPSNTSPTYSKSPLKGVIDMGSNGIRFSISDTSTRSLTQVFSERAAISLYDARKQNADEDAIPSHVIDEVVKAIQRFKRICIDFGVDEEHDIYILATEATRSASNSRDFILKIESKTGLKVSLLSKEEESIVGANGIAASFFEVRGLVLDLGGGSIQLNWMRSGSGSLKTGNGISLPFGAAALTQRSRTEDTNLIEQDLVNKLQSAIKDVNMPAELCTGNLVNLYLSGGGFRGFGYILLDEIPGKGQKPYPIRTINGFSSDYDTFIKRANQIATGSDVNINVNGHIENEAKEQKDIYRISERREGQIPVVAMLVRALHKALPYSIESITFAQGGVRVGRLFQELNEVSKAEDPLLASTTPFRTKDIDTEKINKLVLSALPSFAPNFVSQRMLPALVNIIHKGREIHKDTRAHYALNIFLNGELSTIDGISHIERAALANAMCERWGGEIADKQPLKQIRDILHGHNEILWAWSCIIGRLLKLVGTVYPTGKWEKDLLYFKSNNSENSWKLEVLFKTDVDDLFMTNTMTVMKDVKNLRKAKKLLKPIFPFEFKIKCPEC